MKKKLLTSAAIASFLTAAGIVIPQTDIFAADTPNTPHPSTVPNEHPSTHPSELEKKEKIVTASNPLDLNKVYEGGLGHHNANKKKVDSFAEYVLKDISLDKNKNLNIQTSSDDLSVNSVEYINEANGSKYELNVKKGTVKNSYLADTSKLTGGNYLLNNINLSNSFENKDLNAEIIYTDEENQRGWSGDTSDINLSRKDLYKYDNKTKIKNLSETKLPELGDKDYLVYSDKSQVGGNDVLKVTVKYKPGLERFADKMLLEYYSPNKPGSEAESITGKAMLVYHHKALPGKITLSKNKDGDISKDSSGSFDVDATIDSEGNDVLYFKNFQGMDSGHYYLRQLHDLDLTKGDLSNFEFDLNPSGKSVYRADKVEQPKAEQPKVEQPKVEQPKVEQPKVEGDGEKPKSATTPPLVGKYIESLSSEVTPDGKVVVKFMSKEGLSYNDFTHASVSLFNDKTGNATTHITLYTKDGKYFIGDYAVKNLENGVWKPYEISFTDSNGMPKIIERKDLIPYDKQSQVFIGVRTEEPIGSPQLQGKKVGVFANYKKVKKGTVIKYTIKATDKELKDDSILLVRNGDVYFDHNASRFTHEYDSNGNRVIYVRTENLEPGIYNVISIDGKDKTKLEDIYTEDGWFEVGNEDVRREGPAVWDTVPTTKPSETPKSGESPKPGKEETLKPGETSKTGKEETLKPGETSKPGKEETLKPSEMSKPGKKETPKPDGTPKPSETSKPGKEETLKPSEIPKGDKKETTKSEKDNSWNPFAKRQKAKESSTEVKSEAGEVAAKPVSNRKEGKALPNTGLQTTSYGFLAAIVGLFGAVALRRKNR